MPNSMLADPHQTIADLRRELDECRAERDKRTTEREYRAKESLMLGPANAIDRTEAVQMLDLLSESRKSRRRLS
jgi:hypothetical protein